MKKTLSLFISGLVLAVLGVGLVLINPKDRAQPVKANTSDYTSTWSADELLLVTRELDKQDANHIRGLVNDEIMVGVSKWIVHGGFTAEGRYFAEKWNIPSCLPKFFFERATGTSYQSWTKDWGARIGYHKDDGSACEESEADAGKKWLTGIVYSPNIQGDVDGSSFYEFPNNTLRTYKAHSASATSQGGGSELTLGHPSATPFKGNFNRGRAISCWRPKVENTTYESCIAATGSYAFRDWHNFPSNDKNNPREDTAGTGIMMPLEWTVSGLICDQTDKRKCDDFK